MALSPLQDHLTSKVMKKVVKKLSQDHLEKKARLSLSEEFCILAIHPNRVMIQMKKMVNQRDL